MRQGATWDGEALKSTSVARLFWLPLVLFVFPRFYQRFQTCFPRITRVDQMNFLTSQAFVFDLSFEEHQLYLGGITSDELSYFPDLVFSSVENQHFAMCFPPGFLTRIPRSIRHMHLG